MGRQARFSGQLHHCRASPFAGIGPRREACIRRRGSWRANVGRCRWSVHAGRTLECRGGTGQPRGLPKKAPRVSRHPPSSAAIQPAGSRRRPGWPSPTPGLAARIEDRDRRGHRRCSASRAAPSCPSRDDAGAITRKRRPPIGRATRGVAPAPLPGCRKQQRRAGRHASSSSNATLAMLIDRVMGSVLARAGDDVALKSTARLRRHRHRSAHRATIG